MHIDFPYDSHFLSICLFFRLLTLSIHSVPCAYHIRQLPLSSVPVSHLSSQTCCLITPLTHDQHVASLTLLSAPPQNNSPPIFTATPRTSQFAHLQHSRPCLCTKPQPTLYNVRPEQLSTKLSSYPPSLLFRRPDFRRYLRFQRTLTQQHGVRLHQFTIPRSHRFSSCPSQPSQAVTDHSRPVRISKSELTLWLLPRPP